MVLPCTGPCDLQFGTSNPTEWKGRLSGPEKDGAQLRGQSEDVPCRRSLPKGRLPHLGVPVFEQNSARVLAVPRFPLVSIP